MTLYDRLLAEYPRAGKAWGYVDVGGYHIEVVEFGDGFGWKLHLVPKVSRPVFVAAGYCADVETAWREVCAAHDDVSAVG